MVYFHRNRVGSVAGLILAASSLALGQTMFEVRLDPQVQTEPVSGRLVVYLIAGGSSIGGNTDPADGPFFEDPQPMFGVDVKALEAGGTVKVDDAATSFPDHLSKLPPGLYRAQAVLDIRQEDSSWRRENGNLYSESVAFSVPEAGAAHPAGDGVVKIVLDKRVQRDEPESKPGSYEYVSIKSELLSAFRGHDVYLRAGVVFPREYDASRTYAAVYEVPGFGGDHRGARRQAMMRENMSRESPSLPLASNTFWVLLDPEGPNGHTLFADSANNGPCGRALTEELIPELERRYRLIAEPSARLLRGHSSGGWSTLWLAVTYPKVFGGCWSSSPDPVDFTRMQRPDIYHDKNFYTQKEGETVASPDFTATPSYRSRGESKMTILEENRMEEVIGPDNTSGQQWDSWFAVWGPKNASGHPAALFDPETGVIDHAMADSYRAYDLAERLRKSGGTVGLIFKQRIRLVVGSMDNYYLNEAVERLKSEVDKLSFFHLPEGGHGFIAIVPDLDHGSIFRSKEIAEFPKQMIEHLRRNGHLK